MLNPNRTITDLFSPLTCLLGGALLIMATDRFAHAIVVAGALVWVYCLTSLGVRGGAKIFPERGRTILITFVAFFMTSVYLWLLWLFSPICTMQTFFVISLVPVFCAGTVTFKRLENLSLVETVSTFAAESLVIGILILIFSLIREPFGFSSLSLPGGAQGIVLLFSFETKSVLPIRLIAGSSGALLLLGYSLGLYQYFKKPQQEGE